MLLQVAIDVPSIKATLSDREYGLITSVAGANFGEALRLPPAALWLEEHYAAAQPDEAEEPDQAPRPDVERSLSGPVRGLLFRMHASQHVLIFNRPEAWSLLVLACCLSLRQPNLQRCRAYLVLAAHEHLLLCCCCRCPGCAAAARQPRAVGHQRGLRGA
jgi:hypothetical protein